jgi:hypothetical protein
MHGNRNTREPLGLDLDPKPGESGESRKELNGNRRFLLQISKSQLVVGGRPANPCFKVGEDFHTRSPCSIDFHRAACVAVPGRLGGSIAGPNH